MNERIIKLREPISVGSETVGSLTLRKPKAKDLRAIPMEPSTSDLLNLAGKLCGQPPSTIDELGMADTMELLEVVGGFFPDGPTTGGSP